MKLERKKALPERQSVMIVSAAPEVGLTEEQLDALVAECSEKELFFLKPGLDYTSNLLHEITEKLYGSKTVEELAEEIEREVRRGSKLPCMTAGYSIHDGIMLYLRGLMFQKEHDDM